MQCEAAPPVPSACGSSPRGRGTCTDRRSPCTAAAAGHPRVGGEHAIRSSSPTGQVPIGSSPRGRGTCSWLGALAACVPTRVIPAWAGNISPPRPRRVSTTGHPRVGGEHPQRRWPGGGGGGSSPRGRGTLSHLSAVRFSVRVIPAWAGNIPSSPSLPGRPSGHPRVGGEHCLCHLMVTTVIGSSPRGRGTLRWLRAR